MKNKFFIAALAASVTIPAVVVPIQVDAAAKTFKDVPASYYAHKEIVSLVDRGVIKGFSDGTFKPTNQVTRAEFAAFVARALDLPEASSRFSDVPKTSALYDGVSRAHKAGIIKGFSNGTFRPNTPVTRQDMAVMLDRAMQIKGSYTKTKSLDFSDNAKVGAYAKSSVQRMYAYNVMGAHTGKSFSGTTVGTRAETARTIFNMLQVVEGGTVTVPTPPVAAKSYKDMTVAELKKAFPQHDHVIVERVWKPEPKINVRDMIQIYHDELHDPKFKNIPGYQDSRTPDKWFEFMVPGWKRGFAAAYIDYPMVEVIAYNGKAYKDSEWMQDTFEEYNKYIYRDMPFQPSGKGQWLIDIHRYDDDFVVYRHEDVKWDVLAENPVVIGEDYFVDLFGTLKYGTGITMAKGGLKIAYNGKKIVLANGSKTALVDGQAVTLSHPVQVKNGRAFGPVREIVEQIGLYTKWLPSYKRIEITNFARGEMN